MTDLIILALATWRISYMLVHESGPWSIFDRIRARASGTIGDLFECIYCISIWSSAFLAVLWYGGGEIFVIIMAASGLALMAANYTGMMIHDYD